MAQVKHAEHSKQEALMPLAKSDLRDLFDHLDSQLETEGCDHTSRHTTAFLNSTQLEAEPILSWLREYGGYCDCEALANVEETWGSE